MKRVQNQGRQGDVLLTRVDFLPGLCREIPPVEGNIVLAYGEATGHSHALPPTNTRLLDHNGSWYLEVTGIDAHTQLPYG